MNLTPQELSINIEDRQMDHKSNYLKMLLENHSITSVCAAADEKFTFIERLFCFVVSSLAINLIGAYWGYTIWRPELLHEASTSWVERQFTGFALACVADTLLFVLPIRWVLAQPQKTRRCMSFFAFAWGLGIIIAAWQFAELILSYGCSSECSTQATFTQGNFVYFDGVQKSSFTGVAARWPYTGSEKDSCDKLATETFPSTVLILNKAYEPRLSGVKIQPADWDKCVMLTTPNAGTGIAGCTCSVSTVGMTMFLWSWAANFLLGVFVSEPIKIAVKYALTVWGEHKLASLL
jgi:hypothetical protein